eukprot:9185662-Prorocentrum_lima.AAC.1
MNLDYDKCVAFNDELMNLSQWRGSKITKIITKHLYPEVVSITRQVSELEAAKALHDASITEVLVDEYYSDNKFNYD